MKQSRAGTVLLLAVAGSALGCWYPDPTESDRAVVVQAGEFAQVGYVVDVGREELEKKWSFPASTRLKYKFEGRCNGNRSFGTSTVAVDKGNAFSAWLSYRLLTAITDRVIPPDSTLRDAPSGMRWGDESSHQTLYRGDVARGTVFSGRRGDKVFMFVSRDVYFPDGPTLGRFLAPRLAALEAY